MSEQHQDPFDYDQLMKEVEEARKGGLESIGKDSIPDNVPIVDATSLMPHERTLLIQVMFAMRAMTLTVPETVAALTRIVGLLQKAQEEVDKRDKK